MIRTQVYLSSTQVQALKSLAVRSGKRQSELIREAVDLLTRERQSENWREKLRPLAGIWRDRDDLPDYTRLRHEFDRQLGNDS